VNYAHLHTHSTNSMRDGLAPVDSLVAKAAFLGQPGIALTDHGVLYGAPSLFKACKEFGIRAVPGMEGYEAVPHTFDIERDGEVFKVKWADLNGQHRYFHITLWVMNEVGWRNLVALHTRSWTTEFHPSQRGKPLIDRASLERHNEGLMMGLGCLASRANRALLDSEDAAYEAAKWNAEVFEGRLWMELMGNLPEQIQLQRGQRRVAARLGIPCVGTNDVHYLDRKDGAENGPHHILVRSRRFKKAETEASAERSDAGFGEWYGSDEFYLKSADEMLQTAGMQPTDLEQTLAILDRVSFDFDLLPKPSPPVPVVPLLGDNPDFDAWCLALYEDEPALRALAGDLVG
jgi:DNA polymerase-3 subunit alpha